MTESEINVLYITYDGLTDPLGRSQVLPYLMQLADYGYNIHILSFEKTEAFSLYEKDIQILIDGTSINWFPKSFTPKPLFFAKLYDRMRMGFFAFKLYKRNKYQLIHCRSYVAAEIGLKLKKKFGSPFIFDMRGFWPDEKVDSGRWDQSKYLYRQIYRWYKHSELELLEQSDAIITLTKKAKEYLTNKSTTYQNKLFVIPCCVDLKHFDFHRYTEQQKTALRAQFGIDGSTKVITYIGSTGGFYLTNEVILFFKLLLKIDPHYYMFFITKDNPKQIKAEFEKSNIASSRYKIFSANREEVPLFLSITDLSIYFIRPSFSKIASSPTRHAELMGMGVPIICNDIGDTGLIVKDTVSGCIINSFEEKEYKEAIDQIQSLLSLNSENIRMAAFQYFDLSIGVNTYRKVYQKLTRSSL